MAKNPQVNIDITATDKASRVIEDVAGEVKDLERDDAEVTLKARADSLRAELRKVAGELRDLDTSSTTVKVDADTTGATGKLRALEDDAGRAGGGAGGKFGAGFVRDVGGPVAEGTAGILGDISDAFATAGESVGGLFGDRFGGKVGPAVAQIGAALGTAVAVGGLAYVAIDTLWKTFRDKGDRAVDAAVEKMEKSFETLADTFEDERLREAITEALTPDQRSLLATFGIFLDDLVGLVRGEPIEATEDLEDAFRKAIGVLGPGGLTQPAELAVFTLADALDLTADEAQKLYDKASRFRQIEGILNTQTGAVGRLRDQFRDTQAFVQGGTADVETFGRTIRGLPVEKAVAIYPDLQGETEVAAELERLARDRTARVRVVLYDRYGNPIQGTLPGGMVPVPVAATGAGPAVAGVARFTDGTAGEPGGIARAAGATIHNYRIDVKVAPTADPIATGKAVVDAIRAYERMAGASWRR